MVGWCPLPEKVQPCWHPPAWSACQMTECLPSPRAVRFCRQRVWEQCQR
jgi:hypothetical protein